MSRRWSIGIPAALACLLLAGGVWGQNNLLACSGITIHGVDPPDSVSRLLSGLWGVFDVEKLPGGKCVVEVRGKKVSKRDSGLTEAWSTDAADGLDSLWDAERRPSGCTMIADRGSSRVFKRERGKG